MANEKDISEAQVLVHEWRDKLLESAWDNLSEAFSAMALAEAAGIAMAYVPEDQIPVLMKLVEASMRQERQNKAHDPIESVKATSNKPVGLN